MHSRRYAAAFLVFIAAFLATASVIPNGIVYAEGTKADEMCKAEVKNEKEYNPSKPWGKYWTEKRDGKNVTIFNLFGVTCYDITNKEKTTGHCLRKDRCLATKTAEGEDPKTCKETGACPDGGTSGTGGTAGSEGDESTDIPDEPKPDNSDGVLPLPDEPKPEVKPDPWTSGATPFDQGVPTNSFGDALQQVQNSDSWFAKTIESYFGSPDPMGPETSGIGNNFGAQSMMPQAPNGTESGIGSQGQSLYEQAFNNYSTPSSFPDPSTQSQGAAEPTFAERFGTWAGETVAAAGDMVRDAYEAVSDALVGPANSAESGMAGRMRIETSNPPSTMSTTRSSRDTVRRRSG